METKITLSLLLDFLPYEIPTLIASFFNLKPINYIPFFPKGTNRDSEKIIQPKQQRYSQF